VGDRTLERITEVSAISVTAAAISAARRRSAGASAKRGELVAVPEQQQAITRMKRLRDRKMRLRAIADRMRTAGVRISHVGGKKALAAPDRQPLA
jgi:hypothetical protein